MPLIDLGTTTTIHIGEDWYKLRNELGFYDETVMLVDAVDPNELRSFKLIDDTHGTVKSKQTPGEMVARRNLARILAYLIAWSHPEPLTLENINRIKREDARELLNKIEELEDSIPAPFRDEGDDDDDEGTEDEGTDKSE